MKPKTDDIELDRQEEEFVYEPRQTIWELREENAKLRTLTKYLIDEFENLSVSLAVPVANMFTKAIDKSCPSMVFDRVFNQ